MNQAVLESSQLADITAPLGPGQKENNISEMTMSNKNLDLQAELDENQKKDSNKISSDLIDYVNPNNDTVSCPESPLPSKLDRNKI